MCAHKRACIDVFIVLCMYILLYIFILKCKFVSVFKWLSGKYLFSDIFGVTCHCCDLSALITSIVSCYINDEIVSDVTDVT